MKNLIKLARSMLKMRGEYDPKDDLTAQYCLGWCNALEVLIDRIRHAQTAEETRSEIRKMFIEYAARSKPKDIP